MPINSAACHHLIFAVVPRNRFLQLHRPLRRGPRKDLHTLAHGWRKEYGGLKVDQAKRLATGCVFPFATATSICRNIFTICSGVCFLTLPIPCSFHTSLSHSSWYRICRVLQLLQRCFRGIQASRPDTTERWMIVLNPLICSFCLGYGITPLLPTFLALRRIWLSATSRTSFNCSSAGRLHKPLVEPVSVDLYHLHCGYCVAIFISEHLFR